jgi:hypothetical protein
MGNLFMYFFKKNIPKVNSHPIGENSPNPVTLEQSKKLVKPFSRYQE